MTLFGGTVKEITDKGVAIVTLDNVATDVKVNNYKFDLNVGDRMSITMHNGKPVIAWRDGDK